MLFLSSSQGSNFVLDVFNPLLKSSLQEFIRSLLLISTNKSFNSEEKLNHFCSVISSSSIALKNHEYLEYATGNRPLDENILKENLRHYNFSQSEIAKSMSTLSLDKCGLPHFLGVHWSNSNFVALLLSTEYSSEVCIRETLHAISANEGFGLVSLTSSLGTTFNEALTEYFTNKIFADIKNKLPTYLTKKYKCDYDRTCSLLEDFFICYEEELKIDYINNGQQHSLVSSNMGRLNFLKLLSLTDRYRNILKKYNILLKISNDKEFCKNYELGYINNPNYPLSKEPIKNQVIYKYYYETIRAIRKTCKKANLY